MAAVTAARRWAEDHWQHLQKLLDDPSHDHGLRAMLQPDGLRVAHVVGLFDQLNEVKGGPWKTRFQGRMGGGLRAPMHVWLYHLGGGADAKLKMPSGKAADSANIFRATDRAVNSFRMLWNECSWLDLKPTDPRFAELIERGLQRYNLELGGLRESTAVTSMQAAGGDGGGARRHP